MVDGKYLHRGILDGVRGKLAEVLEAGKSERSWLIRSNLEVVERGEGVVLVFDCTLDEPFAVLAIDLDAVEIEGIDTVRYEVGVDELGLNLSSVLIWDRNAQDDDYCVHGAADPLDCDPVPLLDPDPVGVISDRIWEHLEECRSSALDVVKAKVYLETEVSELWDRFSEDLGYCRLWTDPDENLDDLEEGGELA